MSTAVVAHLAFANFSGAPYSPPSPNRSPDSSSPVFTERPIRPLPKRRIRSRLSAEAADAILAPPSQPSNAPLFYFPYNYGQGAEPNGVAGEMEPVESDARGPTEPEIHHDATNGDEDGIPDVMMRFGRIAPMVSVVPGQNPFLTEVRSGPGYDTQRFGKGGFAPSTASSADGYDSFENTNNKKKRKIPTPGTGSGNQSHLSADLANMGLIPRELQNGPIDEHGNGVSQYYASGTAALPGSGNSMSGPGRGRFGRASNSRLGHTKTPLAVSSDGLNSGRTGISRRLGSWGPEQYAGGFKADNGYQGGNQGIISAAMAAGEKASSISKGQENTSLLQQQSSKTKTQFTFTSTDVTWPGATHGLPSTMSSQHKLHRDPSKGVDAGSQQSPNLASGHQPPNNYDNPSGSGVPPPRKTRRSPVKEYELAARHRRLQQEYNNFNNRPSKEDIYICAFCEYHSIFGTPPLALIRGYEKKDRQERIRAEEKRRLLEKAKANARKGKKGKGAAKGQKEQQKAAQQSQHNHAHDHPHGEPGHSHPHEHPHEHEQAEYYDDDDGFESEDQMPPLAPTTQPLPKTPGDSAGKQLQGQAPVQNRAAGGGAESSKAGGTVR
ncbi:MAG: hypothetical protein M1814_003600 [Vezdaea aestivalis]|nr:MAG: hypothetical protein M1814_003600 [Vezdaea aestivalis]